MDVTKKNSVFIVDDSASILTHLNDVLRSEYSIIVAKDGLMALEIAHKQLPDLILLDVIMPGISGFEVLKQLKEHEKTRSIPVIIMTGIDSAESEVEGFSLGAADYLRKPLVDKVVKHRVDHNIRIINLQRDLERAVNEAEEANQAKSLFLASMSHELRTPMNAIIGVTEIMTQYEQEVPAVVRDGLVWIHSSCDMLSGIIDDILDFSKIEAGKMDIIPAPYDIANMISNSTQLSMMRIDGKPIEFEILADPALPATLLGDELRIKQITNNLLSNAFKYTDSGKVILTVTSEPLPDREGCVTLVLRVQDSGRGISKEQIDSLFVEYSRFNEGINRGIQGTGLGLAITKRLLDLMSGAIEVESELDKGSIFTVRFPQEVVNNNTIGVMAAHSLMQFSFASFKQKNRLLRQPMPRGCVLIVDDAESNRYVAEGLMKPYKLQIEVVTGGREAIEKVISGKTYDIIFMDHMMPELDGMETTKVLRNMGYNEPIVALTANAVMGQSEVFLQNGFDAFIAKPIDIRQLDTVLHRFVKDKGQDSIMEINNNADTASTLPLEDAQSPCAANKDLGLESEIPGINMNLGRLLYEGDDELYFDIMRSFIKLAPAELDKLRHVTQETLPDYAINIHTMKSSNASIGAKDLSERAKRMEKMAKDGQLAEILAENESFIQDTQTLIENIKAWLARGQEDTN